MSVLSRHRWFLLAVGITLASAVVSVTLPRGRALTAISNIGYLLLIVGTGAVMLANAWSTQGTNRRFWSLTAAGYVLWACHQCGWVYLEVVRKTSVPDPWFMDVVLFLHLIPMIAAVGLRPHRTGGEQKFRAGTLDFFLLLVWWVFLYTFIVFPSQYVAVNPA